MCASYSALKINKYLHELLKRLTNILVIDSQKIHFFSDLRALCILHKYVMPLWSYDRWLHEQKTTPKDMTYKCSSDHHLFRIRHRSHYKKVFILLYVCNPRQKPPTRLKKSYRSDMKYQFALISRKLEWSE